MAPLRVTHTQLPLAKCRVLDPRHRIFFKKPQGLVHPAHSEHQEKWPRRKNRRPSGGQRQAGRLYFLLFAWLDLPVFSQAHPLLLGPEAGPQPGGGAGCTPDARAEDPDRPGGPPPAGHWLPRPHGLAPRPQQHANHHQPFGRSPWSFFFWDRPVLRVLDQEKNAPFRFLSLSSSPSSSFSERPDFDFPLSCRQTGNAIAAGRGCLAAAGSAWKGSWSGSGSVGAPGSEAQRPRPRPPGPEPQTSRSGARGLRPQRVFSPPAGRGSCRRSARARPPHPRARPAWWAGHLFGRGHVGVVRAAAVLGGGAAGHVLRVGQRAALHLRQDALLVQLGLEEAGVAVKLHQVEDLPRSAAQPVTGGSDPLPQGQGRRARLPAPLSPPSPRWPITRRPRAARVQPAASSSLQKGSATGGQDGQLDLAVCLGSGEAPRAGTSTGRETCLESTPSAVCV